VKKSHATLKHAKHIPAHDNNEIQAIPRIAKIASSIDEESHCQYFHGTLDGENDGEKQLRLQSDSVAQRSCAQLPIGVNKLIVR